MNAEDRISVYRGMVMTLACAVYNGEDMGKDAVADLLRIENPPETLTDEDAAAALDKIFERAGI